MKLKKLLSIVCFTCTIVLQAQQSKIKFENVVSEQFGTLLESLLVDGKINEAAATAYLETIFGFDETIGQQLQSTNLSKKINAFQPGNLSTDQVVDQLNKLLLTLIPESQKEDMMNNIQNQLMLNNVVGEIKSGQVGMHSINLINDIIQSNREWKKERMMNDEIAKKLEVITPTLKKLNATNSSYKKLHVIDEVDSGNNWISSYNPPELVMTRDVNKMERKTTNSVKLEDGYITLHDNYGPSNTPQHLIFDELRCYKNIEKFDFSKDFSMNLQFKISDGSGTLLVINIGKGYKIFITRNVGSKGNIQVGVQDEYRVTEKYGILKSSEKLDKEKKKLSRNYGYIADYTIGNSIWFYDKTKFDEVLNVNITKIGTVFTLKFLDYPVEVKTEVNYFPDKYYLGFKTESKTNKATTEIHRLELKHL